MITAVTLFPLQLFLSSLLVSGYPLMGILKDDGHLIPQEGLVGGHYKGCLQLIRIAADV